MVKSNMLWFISEISISTDDPFTNNTPSVTSGARTDKFIKITVNGTCRDEIKAR